ncbi:hypothetical protein SSPO_098230 [Streptomyces antimycoticus]|uniref:HTH asnC-type domain-containing protein n=1 Tax=Streptomyces antimycoticus TaxID=68175 RepID=A0A499UY28_9ACTN|nr:hypothetical protein SSPO_098230 [Streptomyces antimycoticus]
MRADGRRTVRDIARLVQLSPAPVRRRITRLEESGVITGYTITTDQAKLGQGLQAVTELRFTGDTDIHDIVEFASTLPEVDEVLTLTGDVDALVRFQSTMSMTCRRWSIVCVVRVSACCRRRR